MTVRVGLGFDSHRFLAGRPLVLGGVTIPFELGLDGHSDADVLVHAVIDAVLGAAGRGNIGRLFPDTDAAYRGADSLALLEEVWRDLESDGHRVVNLDTVVLAERPRLSPYLGAMRERLAAALDISPDQVEVKPKTAEGLGFVGQGQGIAAMAVVAVERV